MFTQLTLLWLVDKVHWTMLSQDLMDARKEKLSITWREMWPIWLTFALLFGFGGLGVWLVLPSVQAPAQSLARHEDVTVDVGELKPGVPRFFAHPLESGQPVEYFVERDTDNHVTVAFASCRRCYREGHFRQGGQILCGHCNEPMMRAPPGQTAPAKDCAQIPIPFETSGDRLTIRANSVDATFARWYRPAISLGAGAARGTAPR